MTKGSSYREIAHRHRKRLFAEQKGLCFYCQRPMLLAKGRADGRLLAHQITLDHIVPLSMGGPKSPTQNTVAACFACNNERGDRDARLFMLEKQGMLA